MSAETRVLSTPGQRAGRYALACVAILVLVLLALPIVVTIPLSFNDNGFIKYPMTGLTMHWYSELLGSAEWRRAILNTLLVGAVSTLISVLLGTSGAYGLFRLQFRCKVVILGISVLPLIVPPIVIALSSYLFFLNIGLANGYATVIIGHVVLGVPFVVLVVYASLQGMNPNLYRAALSLGARPWKAFRTAILPHIARGIAGGAVLAFATSIDELIVAMFVTTAEQRTLPLQMYTGLREQLSPVITAAATLLLIIAALVLTSIGFIQKKSDR